MRFVAGKGAVAELLLAWSRSGAVAGWGAMAELLLAGALQRSSIGKQPGEWEQKKNGTNG